MPLSTVLISQQAYMDNLTLLKQQWDPSIKLCAVVKADAYGHGLHVLAPAAVHAGAAYLGITENHEAQSIRDQGITLPLLRLRPALSEEVKDAVPLQIEEVIGSYTSACLLSQSAQEQNATLRVHLKIDTGISRMGFHLPEQYEELQKSISLPNIKVAGVMTHFPCADDDPKTTTLQCSNFWEILRTLHIPVEDVIVHTSNSAASLSLHQKNKMMVRVGIAAYGLQPSSAFKIPDEMKPVMSWKTRIAQVREVPVGSTIGYGMTFKTQRDSRIATLPIGYANGYLRTLSNNADVLVQAARCPLVGKVSMNMVTIDVTGLGDASIGDEVVLVGQQGDMSISIDELAERAGTISYELACLIGMSNARDRKTVDVM